MQKSSFSFSELKEKIEQSKWLNRKVVDDFLIYYAADKDQLEKEIDRTLRTFPSGLIRELFDFLPSLKSEYIAHRIFSENGLIRKYLNHVQIKLLPDIEYDYLKTLSETPWCFRFAYIQKNPEKDFFEMVDVYREETFLLYSPSIQKSFPEGKSHLYFLLTGSADSCWQSYGPNIYLKGFDPDDIYFFATEINPRIQNVNALIKEIEKNPIPFLFLLIGAEYPLVSNRGFLFKLCQADDELTHFDPSKKFNLFTIKSKKNLHKLALKRYSGFPHYAIAYINTDKHELIRTASTEEGFVKLTDALRKEGVEIASAEADIIISPFTLTLIKKILNRNIILNPYQSIFKEPEIINPELKKHNKFLELLLPYHNGEKEFDLDALARKAGLTGEEAKELWEQVKIQLDKRTGKSPKSE